MDSNLSFIDWLSHPLVLLIAGALVSAFVVPFLTRRWQNHQKELELKTTLLREIDDSLMGMIVKMEVVEMLSRGESEPEFLESVEEMQEHYKEWLVRNAVIESNIRAFFIKNSEIAVDWKHVTSAVYFLEWLSENSDKDTRAEFLHSIQRELSRKLQSEDWINLADRESKNYMNSWLNVKGLIISEKVQLVRKIVESRISGF